MSRKSLQSLYNNARTSESPSRPFLSVYKYMYSQVTGCPGRQSSSLHKIMMNSRRDRVCMNFIFRPALSAPVLVNATTGVFLVLGGKWAGEGYKGGVSPSLINFWKRAFFPNLRKSKKKKWGKMWKKMGKPQ